MPEREQEPALRLEGEIDGLERDPASCAIAAIEVAA